MRDPAYDSLSDLDKLRLLEYKHYEVTLPLANPDLHWNIVYNSQLYIKFELLHQAVSLALRALEAGVTMYAYEEVRESAS